MQQGQKNQRNIDRGIHAFRMPELPQQAMHRLSSRVRLTASSALADYLAWPGLQQVFEIARTATRQRTGQARHETVYGITSLPPPRAAAARLLSVVRQHWAIENNAHGVRDVTYDEERSQVRCGSIPQTLAALRNLVLGLMRVAGKSNIAAACRRCAAPPGAALALNLHLPRIEVVHAGRCHGG